ncbi:Pleiotropic drug resistance protein TUR2 [Morella rubra]|uniref:Pleiotropic drug resistance protein TUR2 n=1 Tax=Morella rubra TaxID=262757 RepID=A0A6A1UVW4_9ROSI|nr:Pleiotropic drug resistance protein TUR2 [Morella rubra]
MEILSRPSREEDNEAAALKWAALERLPTYQRIRRGILTNAEGDQDREIDVQTLASQEREALLDRLVGISEKDNEKFLLKLKDRIERVGLEIPSVEVRFEHLNVEAEVYVGSRALPTICNFLINLLEGFSNHLRIHSSRKLPLPILQDVSGIIKPQRAPWIWKDHITFGFGWKLDNNLKFSGKVTYNGHGMEDFVPQRTSAYVSQHDLHIGEMTVRETLAFAARCQGVGPRFELLAELLRREKAANIKPDPDIDIYMKAEALEGLETGIVTDYVIKILGLEVCADIIVGNEMLRGISGGQKKRVTAGEMLVGPARAFFMDEISTGLDSSTTFQIVNSIKQLTHILNGTTVISLLQPPPETYELFDDIILLSDGQIAYQGPRENVLEFFEYIGFKCPERKGVADFLQEVTSRKDQEQYWARKDKSYRFITVEEFAEAFHSFHIGRKLGDELATPFNKSKGHPAVLTTKKYGVSKKELLRACVWREFLLMKRNSFVYIFKISNLYLLIVPLIFSHVQLTLLAFITMTLFLRTEMHRDTVADGGIYMGALFFTVLVAMFNGISELNMAVMKLPVFYKQRDLFFYPSWAYSVPTWILKIPITFVEAAVWVLMTYYTVGFDPDIGRFFRQYFLIVCINVMASGLFRFLAALGRDMIVANTVGSFALLAVQVLGGFIISRENVQKWWYWGYWVSPLMYGQNAISVNEFLGKSWRHYLNPFGKPQAVLSKETLAERNTKRSGDFIDYHLEERALLEMKTQGIPGDRLELLKGVSGAFRPGVLTALMGVSGAGKTTLLDVLAGRKTSGYVQGSITISGFPKNQETFARTGYRDTAKQTLQLSSPRHSNMLWQIISKLNHIYIINLLPCMQEMKTQGIPGDRLELLKGVSGAFRPGVLTALMGVSGAGKTTLLDVLAGRKTSGYVQGSITISGFPKNQETFARISGYCEQTDIHSPHVTVYESLMYSAWLRLSPEVDSATRKMLIEEVLELVELTSLREAIVGLPSVSGLSTEQRKRLTIAVELVANPSIIFMDEPTSGLDARAAAIVMRTVRNTVDTGRTVVCTIHQPSIDIFDAFDELLLLKVGGEQIYAGPLGCHSSHLIKYFEEMKGVPKIRDGYNPATWMLEVTSTAQQAALGLDFTAVYKNSELYRRRQQDLFNAMGSMYAAVLFIGVQNGMSVQPVVAIERIVFYRERAAGMYSALPYAIGQVIIELPYCFLQTVIYGFIVYSMMGFEWTVNKFLWHLFFMYFTILYFTFFGMMTMAITPNQHVANIASSSFYAVWNIFSGFIVPLTRIPIWWSWNYWACPVAWTLYGLVASQYGDVRDVLESGETVEDFVRSYFGFRHDFLGAVAIVIVGIPVLFGLIFAFSIKAFNFQTK